LKIKDTDVTVLEERPWDTSCPCELKWSTTFRICVKVEPLKDKASSRG